MIDPWALMHLYYPAEEPCTVGHKGYSRILRDPKGLLLSTQRAAIERAARRGPYQPFMRVPEVS